jgi:hypothetical protein
MRASIVSIVVSHIAAGYGVTVMCGKPSSMGNVLAQICYGMDDLGIDELDKTKQNEFRAEFKSGGFLQLGQLQTYSPYAAFHTPVVVLVDVEEANQTLVPDAWAIACKFPDGKPAIVIEC